MTTPTPTSVYPRRKPAFWLAISIGALLVATSVFYGLWRSTANERDQDKQPLAASDEMRGEINLLRAALNERGAEKHKLEATLGAMREETEQLNFALTRIKGALGKAEAVRDRAVLDRDKVFATEYGRTILLAQSRFQEGDIVGAKAHLDATRKELRGWEWHYINKQCTPLEFPVDRGPPYKGLDREWSLAAPQPNADDIQRTPGRVFVVAARSRNRKWRAAVTHDGAVRVTETSKGEVTTVLRHTHRLTSLNWSPDGTRLLTAADDGMVHVWNPATGERLATFTSSDVPPDSHEFWRVGWALGWWSRDGGAVRTERGIWDTRPGPQRFDLRGHTRTVRSAAWNPDGRRVVTTSGDWNNPGGDHTARVWDARTGEPLLVLWGHTSIVQSAEWSRDGKLLVTASQDGTARIWDATSGAELRVLKIQKSDVVDAFASFSPDGTRVVTTGGTNLGDAVRVWDAATGAELSKLEGARKFFSRVRWSADGKRIVTTERSWDSDEFHVWDAATGKPITGGLANLPGIHPEEIYQLDPESTPNVVRIWKHELKKEVASLKGHTGSVHFAAWSPSGKQIVTASSDNTVRVWNATTGKELAVLKGSAAQALWSPDGTRIATASQDSIRIWDARSGQQLAVLKESEKRDFRFSGTDNDSLSWSPDGKRILTRTADWNTVQIWDAESGDEVAHLWGHTPPREYGSHLTRAAWRADGTRFVTEGGDRTVREWDARTGRQSAFVRRVPKAESERPIAKSQWSGNVSISPGGNRRLVFYRCGSLEIYNARTGDLLITFTNWFSGGAYGDQPPQLSWSPDGKRVLIGGHELVDVETGTPLAMLPIYGPNVTAWSTDGSRLATGGEDGTVRVWDGKTGAALLVLRGEQREPDDPRRAPAPKPHVNAVEWSADGKRLLVVYAMGVAWVWDSQPREWPPRQYPEAPAPRTLDR